MALDAKYKAELTETKREIKSLEKDVEKQKRKLSELTEEIANALMGESRFTPDILSVAIDKAKTKIANSIAIISEKKSKLENKEEEFKKLDFYYDQFIGWAYEFDTATLERKRMIASLMFKEITVGTGYEIDALLNSTYSQFLYSDKNY